MTLSAQDMAATHAAAFGADKAWSAPTFQDLCASFGVAAYGWPYAFALIRVVADEAEVLTLATDPAYRRQGHARQALLRAEDAAQVHRMFLEVDASNTAALALYHSCGYQQVGRRKGYYDHGHGVRHDALTLLKNLT